MAVTEADGKWRALDTMRIRGHLGAMAAVVAAYTEPALAREDGDAWGRVEESVKEMRALYLENQLLEGAGRGLGSPWAFNSTLFNVARTLVRHAEEKDKPWTRSRR